MKRPTNYKEYDEGWVISEIKRYRLEGYPDKDIISFLKMPERTFYDYVKRMYGQERAFYEENRKRSQEMLREEVQLAKDRLLESYRRLKNIAEQVADDKDVKRQDKSDVEHEIRETVISIMKLIYEKPIITGETNDSRQAVNTEQEAKQPAS